MRVTVLQASEWLRQGQPVGVPTETVYGLAARVGDEKAVQRVFALKGRPSNNPLIVHVPDWSAVKDFIEGEIPEGAEALAQAFWPGPLTLILPVKAALVPMSVRAGLPTAAFRVPQHPLARELLTAVGPLVMPSANLSGRPSATSPSHVEADFGSTFPVIDGGSCSQGLESTIVTWQSGGWQIARLGALSAERLSQVLGYLPIYCTGDDKAAPLCPGRLHKHYAPRARLHLSTDTPLLPRQAVVGFNDRIYPSTSPLFAIGSSLDPVAVASGLYAVLRALDDAHIPNAWVDMDFPRHGLWQTIAERLERAAAS